MTTNITTSNFVHLRAHSEYSVVDGIARIPDLVSKASENGQPAIALTDLGNLFGLIKFYKSARKQGVKPIAGVDVWLENELDREKPSRLLLLVKNYDGYLELCEILSRAWLENQYRGRAEVRRDWLESCEGLIVLSGGRYGDVGQAIESGNLQEAIKLAKAWAAQFPNHYYIELQRTGKEGDENYVQAALHVAVKTQVPVVATHPIQFINPDDYRAHEVRVCIASGELLASPTRTKHFTPEQYFYSSQQMLDLFSDVPSALENTYEIAKRCNLSLTLDKPRLPDFPTPDGIGLDEYLIQLSEEGLQQRMLNLYPDKKEREERYPEYLERLHWECKTIIGMGFPGYFLIVADFINWAKSNGVPVGPGRGSGAGSLVAYALGITDLDPIAYDLLFERFLNPERVSMPDFDIDFCQDNRERVIEYVKEKYGRKAVSQISTFGTLGAKAVVRDVGRVVEMPYSLCDALSKLIPFSAADPWTLERALAHEPAFKERYENEEDVQSLIDLARPLEGLTRNVGMHAGGVLIAPGKLTDFCPLYCQPGSEGSAVSQFDKDDVESAGLVKFDFLGLRNLTILDWAVRYVREFNKEMSDFDLSTLTLDDPKVYELLSQGNTTAVFQLESRGMKELLRSLRPSNFEDIIAMLALYRPGPLESGMVVDFVDRKHGRASVDYFHDDLEPVLKSTYGVIVYQEQVMLISQIIGGYSLGEADLLRRAMGKKKPEEMAMQRELFEQGAIKKGHDPKLAVKLFDLMEKFAGYGFNKSHSAAYALIAYHTAWLKAYHPAEFFAATLSSDLDDTDKVQAFWRDALANGIEVLPPDVNYSNYRFEPVIDEHAKGGKPPRTIRYGLGAIKGTGHSAIESIIAARNADGPFKSLFDFCRRIDRHVVNRRTIEALIKSGAFDSIDSNRAALLATVGQAIAAAEQAQQAANQVSLFDDTTDDFVEEQLAKVPEWSLQQKLTFEKSAIGFFFSGHLFDAWASEVRHVAPTTLSKLVPANEPQWFAGVLSDVRSINTRRGRMMYATLDDGTGQVEVAVFSELFEQHRSRLVEDKLIIVYGRVSHDEYSGGLRVSANDIYDLQMIREERAKCLRLVLNDNANASELRRLLNPYRAEPENNIPGVPVEVVVKRSGFSCAVRLGSDWQVRMTDSLIDGLEEWVTPEGLSIMYS